MSAYNCISNYTTKIAVLWVAGVWLKPCLNALSVSTCASIAIFIAC